LVDLFKIRREPNRLTAVRLPHKISQQHTFLHVPGDVSNDRDREPVLHKLLHDFVCHSRLQTEELFIEPLGRNDCERDILV
jgi:hypothetical protein